MKLEMGIVKRFKIVACDQGVGLSEYLAEILRSVVDRDWSRIVRLKFTEEEGE